MKEGDREYRQACCNQHLWGCQVLGSLGAKAFHNPIPLHAIEEEEVVVRRVSLRQGLHNFLCQNSSNHCTHWGHLREAVPDEVLRKQVRTNTQ